MFSFIWAQWAIFSCRDQTQVRAMLDLAAPAQQGITISSILRAQNSLIPISHSQSIIKLHSFSINPNPHKTMLTTKLIAKQFSTNTLNHLPDPISRLSKIMMSCPKSCLEATLNESGIRISPDLVEQILKKFENAGMQSYRFFEWASKQRNYTHSIKSYHTIISSLAKIRQYKLMWDIVNEMKSKSLLNVETFGVIMRKYARARRVSEAIYTFNVMEKYGVDPNLEAFNSLLSAFCKSKNVRKAQEIFDSLKDRFGGNSKTYSILLEGWGKDPNLPKAREVFRSMVESGCDPDIVTYGIMVDVLCKAGRVEEALGVVREMDARGCRPSSFVYSVLIHTYGIDNQIEDAIDAFLEMERNGIVADVVVYNALIGAFCKVNRFKNVYRVLDEMEKKGITPNARTCNVMINGLIGRGNTDEAYLVFRRMIKVCEPDVDTYTIMIKMFCANDNLDKALKVWRYMSLKKFVPSMHTFSVLINGLCAKEEVSKACVLMEEMLEKGIQPSGSTFGRLRQLLIKEKREDVLEFLIEKMNVLVKEPLLD